MAIQWKWDEKIGEAIFKSQINNEEKQFTINIYEGNCFMIFLNEWNEDGKDKYNLYSFFADENHAKICLGLSKKKEYAGNIFDDGVNILTRLRINKKKARNWKKIVTMFVQAFDNIIIEVYTEEEDD